MSRARGRYILLLNPDAFVAPDTLPKTVSFMDRHPRSGVLGVKLVDENGRVQPSAFRFPTPWNIFLSASRFDRLDRTVALYRAGRCASHRVRLGAEAAST